MLLFVCSLLSNLDHGSVPGLSVPIKNNLEIQNFKFGLLGTIVYLGFLFGSLASAVLFQKAHTTKLLLVIAITFNGGTLLAFTQLTDYYSSLFSRFICGFFQVFFCIYCPVWGDIYGSHRQKSIWITLFSISSPLGIFLGFALASMLNNDLDWKYAFYIQAFFTIPCLIGLLITGSHWLNIEQAAAHRKDCERNVLVELGLPADYLQVRGGILDANGGYS